MSELRFDFAETHRETLSFYDFAKPFLDPTADPCLKGFAANLLTIQSKAALRNNPSPVVNKSHLWKIQEDFALLTKPSECYEGRDRKTGKKIVGRLTALWCITPDARISNKDAPKQFRITGNASVKVEWLDASDRQPIGEWTVDVADTAAPGCMFHVQFPCGIPVPRIPSIAFTPMAVAEQMLGELFQDD